MNETSSIRRLKGIKNNAMSIIVPVSTRQWVRARLRGAPPPGNVQFGDLRRTSPISNHFGFDRGLPVDRYYIENFLHRHAEDIHGSVLEIKSNAYTRRYGKKQVEKSEVLDIDSQNPEATIITDLTHAREVSDNTFDCIILTQTLQLIFDFTSALQTCSRILKPGGVLLITVPGITQMDYKELGHTWLWSFTEASMKRLLEEIFGPRRLTLEKHGNVLSAAAFLYGITASELTSAELNDLDPDYQLLIAARAVKV